jgi:transcriptional regulator with XRE-family HTH domain
MKVAISETAELGQWIRQVRRAQGLRQEDVAALSQSSHVTLKQLEHGAGGVAIGRVLAVLKELGIRLELDLPDEYAKPPVPARKRTRPSP